MICLWFLVSPKLKLIISLLWYWFQCFCDVYFLPIWTWSYSSCEIDFKDLFVILRFWTWSYSSCEIGASVSWISSFPRWRPRLTCVSESSVRREFESDPRDSQNLKMTQQSLLANPPKSDLFGKERVFSWCQGQVKLMRWTIFQRWEVHNSLTFIETNQLDKFHGPTNGNQ